MTRRHHDQYFTPASACEVLKRHWQGWKQCTKLIEPCVGQGDIVRSFREINHDWYTCDIDPAMSPNYVADMTDWQNWKDRFDCPKYGVITNPPFSSAFEIVSNALFADCKVAALLRLSFLEPTRKRGTFLGNNPPDLVIVLPRISFTGDGKTDSVTCAWMIWDRDIKGKGIIVSPKP